MKAKTRRKRALVQAKVRMVRMSADLEARIQEYRQRHRAETGVDVSFTAIVRALIEKGLKT